MMAVRSEGVVTADMTTLDVSEEAGNPEETLSQWIYYRFSSHRRAKEWEYLSDEEKDYWAQEARAVEGAVARNGSSNYLGQLIPGSAKNMLKFALDEAQEKVWSREGFTEDDQRALDQLNELVDQKMGEKA